MRVVLCLVLAPLVHSFDFNKALTDAQDQVSNIAKVFTGSFGSLAQELEKLRGELEKREADVSRREDGAKKQDHAAKQREEALNAHEISMKQQFAKQTEEASRREDAVLRRENDVSNREKDLERRGLEVQQWHEQRQDEQRRLQSNKAAFTVAYHVQTGGMKGEVWSTMVNSIRVITKLPEERFVPGQPDTLYPIVLLFLVPGGPRLSGEIVKMDEVKRCREMVAPDGVLVLVSFRLGPAGGSAPQAATGYPDGIDQLIEFAYTTFHGTRPINELTEPAASEMNAKAVATLKHLVVERVPPPPVLGPSWLFPWLKKMAGGMGFGKQEL